MQTSMQLTGRQPTLSLRDNALMVAQRRPRVLPRAALAVAMVAQAAVLTTLAILVDRAFNTGRFDLGNMVQAVWSTAHGHVLAVTDLRGHPTSRLAAHFDPILAAFGPLWRLWPSADMLLTVQAAAVALGAIPVYRLAHRHLGSEAAGLAFGVAYLLYPATGWLVLNEFHPVALATPLLLFALWYLDGDRLVPFALLAAVAVTTKEDVGITVAGLGVWYALAHRRRRAGIAIAAAGLAVSALALYVVVPHFHGAPSHFYARYAAIGGSPGEVLLGAVEHPLRTLEILGSTRHLVYVADLLLPLLALPLLSPLALVAVPTLALNVLSAQAFQSSVRFHYTATAIPPLVGAAILGAKRLQRLGRPVLVPLLVAAVAGAWQIGPLLFWPGVPGAGGDVARAATRTAHDAAAATALRQIPSRVPVSATNSLGAHLSARRTVFSFPVVRDARWIAVDEKAPSFEDRVESIAAEAEVVRFRHDPRWRLVFERDGVLVFRRQGA